MNAPVAEVRALSKRYGPTAALEDVSLAIRAGECLALVGHNGSGKSTLIKALLGLVRPQSGEVRVLGSAPGDAVRSHRGLGYLPENVAFDPGMTGRQVMRFYARLKGLAADAGEPLLERVGLAEAAGRRVRGYSKGMRQRLGLAQALLGQPRLLLLDEPTTGLDPALRRQFYDIVLEIKAQGCAVLISSHALSELEAQADRVAILSRGRLLTVGTLADIRSQADLPVRLLVKTRPCHGDRIAAGVADALEITKPDAETLRVVCRQSDKMDVMRALVAADGVLDVITVPATLDEIYSHFATQVRS